MIRKIQCSANGGGRPVPAWWIGLGSFLLCAAALFAYCHWKFFLHVPPAATGDEVDYDSIGWELAHGRGFAVDTGDPEFRKPYEEAAKTETLYELGPPRRTVVTYRPPIYPFAISVLNRAFGRQFWAIRVMDILLMAGTLAFITVILYRRFGRTAALVAVILFIAVDVRTRLYGRAILTEAMSLFFTSLLIAGLLSLQEKQDMKPRRMVLWSAVLGVVFGISILTRTLMVIWIPWLCLALIWILRGQGQRFKTILGSVTALLVATGLILAPWAVWNLKVIGEFMPMGTQGLVQMSAAFGDEIWNSGGVWVNLDHTGFFDEIPTEALSPLEQEIRKAKFSRAKAIQWIQSHPGKALLLFPLKIWQECRPRNIPEGLILALSIVGILASWRTNLGLLMLAIIAINLFAVGVTWSVEGRFLVPVLLPIHIFVSTGALWIGNRLAWINAKKQTQ